MHRLTAFCFVTLVFLLTSGSVVFADTAKKAAPAPAKAAPQGRTVSKSQTKVTKRPRLRVVPKAMGFVDTSRVRKKRGWDYPYLFAAYILTWIFFLIYIFSLRQRLQRTEVELRKLEQVVDELIQEDEV